MSTVSPPPKPFLGPELAGTLVIREDETYRTPLLPGFELPLARLFALANRWRGSD